MTNRWHLPEGVQLPHLATGWGRVEPEAPSIPSFGCGGCRKVPPIQGRGWTRFGVLGGVSTGGLEGGSGYVTCWRDVGGGQGGGCRGEGGGGGWEGWEEGG